jgi:hypothetical protein
LKSDEAVSDKLKAAYLRADIKILEEIAAWSFSHTNKVCLSPVSIDDQQNLYAGS